jgi:hypothetical protein
MECLLGAFLQSFVTNGREPEKYPREPAYFRNK